MNSNSAMEVTMQLHHVTFPVPPDSIDQAHAFYGDVIGLEQIPVRREVQHLAAWYRLGTCELHLLVNSDWKPPRENPDYAEAGAHFAFVIPTVGACIAAIHLETSSRLSNSCRRRRWKNRDYQDLYSTRGPDRPSGVAAGVRVAR